MSGPLLRVLRYGPDPDQFLELTVPEGAGPLPVVVVVHGGFWRAAYGVELARPLAGDLAGAGFASVAVEYRRVGGGGGWPATLEDVAAAVDRLATAPEAARLDLADVSAVGHSAGGHLAAWLAGRHLLSPGSPGAAPRVRLGAVVLQAGVLDLGAAEAQRLGNGAVRDFLGGTSAQVPDRYAVTDPVRLLPTGAVTLCLHGSGDDVVPLAQSERYAAAARAVGDRVELRVVPGDHMALVDPASPAWAVARDWLTHGRPGAPYA